MVLPCRHSSDGKTGTREELDCPKSRRRRRAGIQGIEGSAPGDHVLLFVQWGLVHRLKVAVDRLGGMVRPFVVYVEVAVL